MTTLLANCGIDPVGSPNAQCPSINAVLASIGQLVAGAIASAFVGQAIHPGTAWIHLPLALLAAALAGALWALIAAWLKVRRGVHEVISTIMLNWTAIYLQRCRVQRWEEGRAR